MKCSRLFSTILLCLFLQAGAQGCDDSVTYSGVAEPEPDSACGLGEEVSCDCAGGVEGSRVCVDGGFFGPCRCPVVPSPAALRPDPDRIDFGQIEPGAISTTDLLIHNDGETAAVALVSIEGEGFSVDEADLAVGPGERLGLRVRFEARQSGVFSGALRLNYAEGELVIPLSAQVLGTPCLQVDEDLSFDPIEVGGSTLARLGVVNCGETRLSIDLDEVALGPHFLLSPPATVVLEAGETREVELIFEPLEGGLHRGVLGLETGDVGLDARVDLVGQAYVRGECPVAVGGVRLMGTVDFVEVLTVEGGGELEFDASASYDPDNRDDPLAISEFLWEIREAPRTFDGDLRPNPRVESPSLEIDTPGRYVFALSVVDQMGNVSCEADEVVVTLRPEGGLTVVLTWETPEDPILGDDRGGDLDLHLLHPNGRWGTSPWDCHWQNRTPNWGDINTAADDPSLDQDSTASGPETIDFPEPELLSYSVGVHYGRDNGFGPSVARVEVYMGEALVFSDEKTLTDPQFWEVLRVDWATLVITEVDTVSPDIP
jgi:hypothetical protein